MGQAISNDASELDPALIDIDENLALIAGYSRPKKYPPEIKDVEIQSIIIPCTICSENNISTIIIPCNHACLCNNCARIYGKGRRVICPICRGRVKKIENFYLQYKEAEEDHGTSRSWWEWCKKVKN